VKPNMEQFLARILENLARRVTGPMKFRLVLQPFTAIFLATLGGLRDARAGKPPYFWALFADARERSAMLKDGWKSVGRLFLLALGLDVVYQFIERRFVYPGEAVLVAVILAIVPYLLVRGSVNRIARLSVKTSKERKIGA
jgi:hypothetical protein